jgi:Zn-dependent peptidase ImmA (M78 family)
LDETGVDGPPVDAFRLARRLGIVVAVDDQQKGRARYVRLRSYWPGRTKPAILLRPDPRPEREQWAVAHEIGEHVAHRWFDRLGVDPRETVPSARETVASELAGRLLLPDAWFVTDAIDCEWDLLRLKSRYSTVSHEMIARRMLQ